MTIEDFREYTFTFNTIATYLGKEFKVWEVDYGNNLICFYRGTTLICKGLDGIEPKDGNLTILDI